MNNRNGQAAKIKPSIVDAQSKIESNFYRAIVMTYSVAAVGALVGVVGAIVIMTLITGPVSPYRTVSNLDRIGMITTLFVSGMACFVVCRYFCKKFWISPVLIERTEMRMLIADYSRAQDPNERMRLEAKILSLDLDMANEPISTQSSIIYPRIYKMDAMVRGLILFVGVVIGLVFGTLAIKTIAHPPTPDTIAAEDVSFYAKNPHYLFELCIILLIDFCGMFYVLRRRVILNKDSIEIRNLFITKKYFKADIEGISNKGAIILKDKNFADNNRRKNKRSFSIPFDIHPDSAFKNWFGSLPKIEADFNFKLAENYKLGIFVSAVWLIIWVLKYISH